MSFFEYSMRTTLPTGIGLSLPEDFAWSRQRPEQTPLPGVEVAEQARRWVDLMVTNSPGLYLYSEAVVHMVQEEGFGGIEFFAVEVARVESKHLRAQTPWPRYYVGRVTGRIGAIVANEMGGEPLRVDEQTGLYQFSKLGGLEYYQLQPESWDGSDFMHVSTVYTAHRLCTARVKAAVEQRKLRNFNFYSEREPNVLLM